MSKPASLIKSERGFTLFELIVVALLLTFMSAILYSTLKGVIRAKESGEIYRESERTAHYVLSRMISEFSSRGFVPLIRANDEAFEKSGLPQGVPVYFFGTNSQDGDDDNDTIRFVTSSGAQRFIDSPSNFGLVEVEYRLEKPAGQVSNFGNDKKNLKTLVRRELPALVEDDQIRKERTIVFPLAENVTSLNFRFLKQGKWQNDWKEANANLPEAIEITLGVGSVNGEKQIYRTAVFINVRQKPGQFGAS